MLYYYSGNHHYIHLSIVYAYISQWVLLTDRCSTKKGFCGQEVWGKLHIITSVEVHSAH